MRQPRWLTWLLTQVGGAPETYVPVPSPALLGTNRRVIDEIFRANALLTQSLAILGQHSTDPRAAAEIRRLAAYRELMIEFAGMAAADEGDLLSDTLFEKADRWIDERLLEARKYNVDPDTFEGYMRMKRCLERRVVLIPESPLSF